LLAEQTRLHLWGLLSDPTHELTEVEDDSGTLMDEIITTDNLDNGIKVTVKDVLPRNAGITMNSLRVHWLSIMHHAFSKTDKKFNKILCIINVVCPANHWDVDNRAYKIIIDSLRYNQLIPNDTNKYLSFMVTSEVDIDDPRTEIYVIEHPENLIFHLSNLG
jgi:hypothetical protein